MVRSLREVIVIVSGTGIGKVCAAITMYRAFDELLDQQQEGGGGLSVVKAKSARGHAFGVRDDGRTDRRNTRQSSHLVAFAI